MARQAVLPDGSYMSETGARTAVLPSGQYLTETQQIGAAGQSAVSPMPFYTTILIQE